MYIKVDSPIHSGFLEFQMALGLVGCDVMVGRGNPKPPPRISIPGHRPLASIGSGGHVCLLTVLRTVFCVAVAGGLSVGVVAGGEVTEGLSKRQIIDPVPG